VAESEIDARRHPELFFAGKHPRQKELMDMAGEIRRGCSVAQLGIKTQ
jgi:hypothetical protein